MATQPNDGDAPLEGDQPLDYNEFQAVPLNCVGFHVRKASRAVSSLYDEALEKVGLRGTQFPLLLVVEFTGQEGIGAIASTLVSDRTTITRNLRPLIKKGYVTEGVGTDRRTRVFALTREGRAKVREAFEIWKQVQEQFVKNLGDERFEVLKALTNDLVTMADR